MFPAVDSMQIDNADDGIGIVVKLEQLNDIATEVTPIPSSALSICMLSTAGDIF